MKKIFLALMAFAAINVSAQVAYLLPNGTAYNQAEQTFTGFPEEIQAEVAQNPELNAADWFKATYVTVENPTGSFVTTTQFVEQMADIRVLWIHIDRVADLSGEGAIDQFKAELGFDAQFISALKTFVANGGNVLLSKQATHLVGDLGRASYPEFNTGGYINEKVKWFVATNFANRDNSTHHIYARHQEQSLGGETMDEELAYLEDEGHVLHTDHNCGWGTGALGMADADDYAALAAWEDNNHARVIGTWGGCKNMPYAGMVEFYPYSYTTEEQVTIDCQGTVLCLGLATYMWHSNNLGYGKDNVRHMTSCALEYLMARPQGATDGQFAGQPMEDVLENEFFYPSNVSKDSVVLHPVVENLAAEYAIDSEDAEIVEVEGQNYLVFNTNATVTLMITLTENRPLMPWTKGAYEYTRDITYTQTPTAIENHKLQKVMRKRMENGRLIIENNGVIYNAVGAKL